MKTEEKVIKIHTGEIEQSYTRDEAIDSILMDINYIKLWHNKFIKLTEKQLKRLDNEDLRIVTAMLNDATTILGVCFEDHAVKAIEDDSAVE